MLVNRKQALTPAELVLWLVSASTVWGRARLQREAFILWKEHQDIPALKERGLLEESLSVYRATSAGHKYIKQRLHDVGVSSEQIAAKKRSWDEWGLTGFTTYSYRCYPEYMPR